VPPIALGGLTEASGLAPSLRQPGTYWTLNDSGNAAELFHFDLEGHGLGRYPVGGVENRDWEDLASGPCPGSGEPCLFIGEIGDNKRKQPWIAVYAVGEPADLDPTGVLATWRAHYPDGPHNAEALLRDPASGRLYVVTKENDGRSGVFRFPRDPSDEVVTLERVATLQLEGPEEAFRQATSGAWSADGRRVVLRSYVLGWEWDVDPARPEAFWGDPPRVAWLAGEERGEGICYLPDGALLTNSEGAPMRLRRAARAAGR